MMNFNICFLNMDISLIMTVKCLKPFTHDAKTHLEILSKNFDLCFSFCFIVSRKMEFANICKKTIKDAHFLS